MSPLSDAFTEPETIQIVLNGEPKRVPPRLSVWELLVNLGVDPERVAVELNRAIVRQPDWRERKVSDGSSVEIVQFVGGG